MSNSIRLKTEDIERNKWYVAPEHLPEDDIKVVVCYGDSILECGDINTGTWFFEGSTDEVDELKCHWMLPVMPVLDTE